MKSESDAPILPTEDRVTAACKEFDKENSVIEQALKELFTQYRGNNNYPHVLLKVVALNRLYSTQIFAVYDVAHHIYEQAQAIDSGLAIGSPEIVDRMARVTISATGKERINYSFATKYCSWHNPDSYPIWDSRVKRYLRSLNRTPCATVLGANPDLWNCYQEFVELMTAFRTYFKLDSFSFKDIDKFLWTYGRELATAGDSGRPA